MPARKSIVPQPTHSLKNITANGTLSKGHWRKNIIIGIQQQTHGTKLFYVILYKKLNASQKDGRKLKSVTVYIHGI